MFDAEDDVDWMKKNGKLFATPNVGFTPAEDNNDIASLRAEINSSLCEYTWNLIMTCPTDGDFETMWDEMVITLDGLGYRDLYEYDCNLWQPEIDAKAEQHMWVCPECGRTGNTGNYCGECGHPAP